MTLASYLKSKRKYGISAFTLRGLMEERGLTKNATINALHRLKLKGEIISPVRGLYVAVPPKYSRMGCIPAPDLVPLIMDYLGIEYYIGLLSAATLHGASAMGNDRFQIIANKRILHPSQFGQVKLSYIYKKTIKGLPTQDITTYSGSLKVATPELTALDVFNYSEHCGGLNRIATVLSQIADKIDAQKLIKLAADTRSTPHLQRIGYILDHVNIVEKDKSEEVRFVLAQQIATAKPHYLALAPHVPKVRHPRCKKWRIAENISLSPEAPQ